MFRTRIPPPIPRSVRKDLSESDPDLLKKMEQRRATFLDTVYPKPTGEEIMEWVELGKQDFTATQAKVGYYRGIRFERDMTPEKWQRRLNDGRRVRTRWSHNEINRVSAIQLHNGYKVKIPPKSDKDDDRERASAQQRFLNALHPALERANRLRPLRQTFVRRQIGDGLGVYEFYLTKAYDDLDLERREDESTREYNKRTEQELMQAGLPFGLRNVDRLSLVYDEDEQGMCRIGIIEDKPKPTVLKSLMEKLDEEEKKERMAPSPGLEGTPTGAYAESGSRENSFSLNNKLTALTSKSLNSVEVIRYYDPRWTAYIVDGEVIGEVEEHGLPDIPIFVAPSVVTGSPMPSEAFEGVTWGTADLEVTNNDLLTLDIDNLFSFNKPKLVATMEMGSPAAGVVVSGQAPPLDFSADNTNIPQLLPGQRIEDVTANFRLQSSVPMIQFLMGVLQGNGLNPVAQGQAPGADAAGYTVNNLMGAAMTPYYPSIENEAAMWGDFCDYVRLVIRDTLQERVYISAPMGDAQPGGTEWLSLDPDDIDETPADVKVDPLNEMSRIPIRSSMQADVGANRIPLEVYWREGYGVDDPDSWNRMLVVQAAYMQIIPELVQLARDSLRAEFLTGNGDAAAAAQAAQAGQQQAGGDGADLAAVGGTPAPLQPPETPSAVGAGSNRTSIAGADNGYRPPAGRGETAGVL